LLKNTWLSHFSWRGGDLLTEARDSASFAENLWKRIPTGKAGSGQSQRQGFRGLNPRLSDFIRVRLPAVLIARVIKQ